MSEVVIIALPLPTSVLQPNVTVGSFGGRMLKASATKRYRRLAYKALEAEQIKTLPWPKCSVAASFYHKTQRRRDEDNAIGSLKAAYDGLVDARLVIDDDYAHMHREPPTFSVDRNWPRVMLTITRIDA